MEMNEEQNDFEYVLELFKQKKEATNLTDDDLIKLETIGALFNDPNCFFDMDIELSLNILSYLGIPDEEIKSLYFRLISPKNKVETVMVRELHPIEIK